MFENIIKKPIKFVKIEELNEYDCTICLNTLQRDTVSIIYNLRIVCCCIALFS